VAVTLDELKQSRFFIEADDCGMNTYPHEDGEFMYSKDVLALIKRVEKVATEMRLGAEILPALTDRAPGTISALIQWADQLEGKE